MRTFPGGQPAATTSSLSLGRRGEERRSVVEKRLEPQGVPPPGRAEPLRTPEHRDVVRVQRDDEGQVMPLRERQSERAVVAEVGVDDLRAVLFELAVEAG